MLSPPGAPKHSTASERRFLADAVSGNAESSRIRPASVAIDAGRSMSRSSVSNWLAAAEIQEINKYDTKKHGRKIKLHKVMPHIVNCNV